jgi:hypothetical protein
MEMSLDLLKDIIRTVEELELAYNEARAHILRHLRDFSPEELECMAMDGIINYDEIPEDKRTDFVKSMLSGKRR